MSQSMENARGNTALTTREQDVVRLVSSGLPNKSIAHELGLEEGTVKIHLHNIYKKLGVPNRATLALIYVTANLSGRSLSAARTILFAQIEGTFAGGSASCLVNSPVDTRPLPLSGI
jgi:DNA-binding CsgD family transcriptional regulator